MLSASRRLRTQPGAVSPVACGDGFIARSGTCAGFLSRTPLVDSFDDEEPLAGLDEAEPPGTPGERLRRVGLGDLAGELVALGAKAILVPTYTGRTASVVARLRPRRPVIGLSHHRAALQHMALEWGVVPMNMPEAADVEELWACSLDVGRESGLLDEGDLVVLTAGTAVNLPGSTDMIKLSYA